MQTLIATSVRLDQEPHIEKPKRMRSSAAVAVLLLSNETPPYCRSAAGMALTGSSGDTTCSSSGVTSDTTVTGKVPLQVGPAASVPVQTSVPARVKLVLPVPLPPVTTASSAVIREAGRAAL